MALPNEPSKASPEHWPRQSVVNILQQFALLSSYTDTEQVPSQVCVMKAFSTSHALSHSERPHQSHAWAVVLTSVEKTRRRSLEFEVAAPPSPVPLSSSPCGDA